LVFTGSNCIFSSGSSAPVKEDATPAPAEIYGRSKLEGEKLILAYGEKVPYSIIRCPTIIAAGRLGLLSILFDFIREGRRVWLIGKGDNRYQFIYARDLAGACMLAMQNPGRQQVFNIGSDSVPTLGGAFAQLIQHAGSGSKLVSVPRAPALAAMRLAYLLGLSPLGPYHYRMIAENFVFDTTHIKTTLGWKPSVTNGEMLIEAYQWYLENYNEITREQGCSAHRSRARMGIISLIKAIS
jgi:nucleoside-diphosphate-sugar epimerase